MTRRLIDQQAGRKLIALSGIHSGFGALDSLFVV
jgi:hypothetical protein